MNRYSSYSIMGANINIFNDKYCMDEGNVYATWRATCKKNEDVIRVCMQVKELVDIRDKYINGLLIKHAKCIYFIFLILF